MKAYSPLRQLGLYLVSLTFAIHIIAILGGSSLIYRYYQKYVFNYIRIYYDNSIGHLPFPFLYIVLPIFIWSWIYLAYKIKSENKSQKAGQTLKSIFLPLGNLLGLYIFLFYFLWGMNYYRPAIQPLLHWQETIADSLSLKTELQVITKLAEKERTRISVDTHALQLKTDWKNLEDSIRNLQTKLLQSWSQPTPGCVRIRGLYPKGSLLCISTAGVYIPYVCEGHVDIGIHKLQWPFTLAHEMAHGYGWTDEGECNLVGMLTCMKSNDPVIRYSALLTYWRYLYYDFKEKEEANATTFFELLPKGIKADLIAIRANNDAYPEYFTAVRDVLYDAYLKMHGMPSGMDSYSQLVMLMHHWKYSKDAFDLNLEDTLSKIH